MDDLFDLNFKRKNTNPARGILDFYKQKLWTLQKAKDGSWNWGIFAHREISFCQPVYSIQVRHWGLCVRPS